MIHIFQAFIIVVRRGIVINETVWIWKAVKLLVISLNYWLAVLVGNHSSCNLKLFVELKAIYFRECFHTASLLYVQIQFGITIQKKNLLPNCIPEFLAFLKYIRKPLCWETITHTIFCLRQWLEFLFQNLHK